MPPPEIHLFEPRQIIRGPDEIRGQVGSLAFIYTNYADPDGNHWFVEPGYIGHEEMTNTPAMLQALFGPEAEAIYSQVASVGDVFGQDEHGHYVPTGERRWDYDWRTIRLLAKRENLFGRAGVLCNRQVVMLWGDPPGWEAMLVEVLGHMGIVRESEAVIVMGNSRQYRARDFIPPVTSTYSPSP